MFECLRINSILLQKIYSLKYITKYSAFWNAWPFQSRQTVCYHALYWRRYCDCVHHGLQMCTEDSRNICQFYRATKWELFCSRKMFTCRKLTGVETLLSFFITFQLNMNTNTCTVNSEHSESISHSNTHTHTHTHTNTHTHTIYIYIYRGCPRNVYTF